jgi:ribonucrease Y
LEGIWIYLIVGLVAGIVISTVLQLVLSGQKKKAANDILSLARNEAETLKKKSILSAREEWAVKEQRRKDNLKHRERKLNQRDQQLKTRDAEIRTQRKASNEIDMELKLREKMLGHKEEEQKTLKEELKIQVAAQIEKLTDISGMTMEDARRDVLEIAKARYEEEAAGMAVEIKNNVRESANREAREVITTAIEKMAADTAAEITIKEVEIPNNRIKGMIIGREGRNIKTFESITDTKMIVDETPDTIVISSFDPVKREIARLALETLIKSRNFTPKTIQDAVNKAVRVTDNLMNEASGKVLRTLNINVHPELKKMLGRLKYRTSYGQNILEHSLEVARIASAMAAELGLDEMLAKRAGLLHDIGKAESNGSERSHVAIGVDVCKRVREHPIVINAVMAHHKEAPPIDPISELVTAADIISSARPGSRRDSVDSYTKRVEKLESIAQSFKGVHRVYALYAGREIRVVTEAEKLSDAMSEKLTSDIAEKISQEMQFPGSIKVVVIRESRSMATAS